MNQLNAWSLANLRDPYLDSLGIDKVDKITKIRKDLDETTQILVSGGKGREVISLPLGGGLAADMCPCCVID